MAWYVSWSQKPAAYEGQASTYNNLAERNLQTVACWLALTMAAYCSLIQSLS